MTISPRLESCHPQLLAPDNDDCYDHDAIDYSQDHVDNDDVGNCQIRRSPTFFFFG